MALKYRTQKFNGIFAAFLVSGTLAASLFFIPATSAGPAPADKRKPGLYWTFETDKGNISCKLFEAEAPVTVHAMVGLAIGKLSYVHPETKQLAVSYTHLTLPTIYSV